MIQQMHQLKQLKIKIKDIGKSSDIFSYDKPIVPTVSPNGYEWYDAHRPAGLPSYP